MKLTGIKRILSPARWVLALIIICLLIQRADIGAIDFDQVNIFYITAAAGLVFLQNFCTALRWYFLLRAVEINISLARAFSLTMQGFFWMLFLPGGTVGGDVVKATLAVRDQADEHKTAAAFSVLVDRICGLAGLLLLSFAVAVIMLLTGKYPADLHDLLYAVAVIAPGGLAVIVLLFMSDKLLKIGFINKLFRWVDSLSGELGTEVLTVLSAYRVAWSKILLAAIFSSVIAFPLFIVALYCISSALIPIETAGNFTFCASVVCGSIGELAGVIPLTPNGVGVRDAFFAWVYSMQLASSIAAQIPLIFTALTTLCFLTGGIFALITLLFKKR